MRLNKNTPLRWPVLFLFVFCSACGLSGKKPDATAVLHKEIANHGVHIDYTDQGYGDTTLLFVHGWCINKTYWDQQLAYFRNRFRVIAIDLPGFGTSGKNRNQWTTEMFGSDIDSVLSTLNLQNVILVGHSMSGGIVLDAAVHAKERVIGIVGVENFKDFGTPSSAAEKEESAKAIELLRTKFRETATQYFNEALFSKTTPDTVRRKVLQDVAVADSVIAIAFMDQPDYDAVTALRATGRKLFLINSDTGPTDTVGFKKFNIPFQVFYIHGTGHFPMIEDPAHFNEALEQCIVQLDNYGLKK